MSPKIIHLTASYLKIYREMKGTFLYCLNLWYSGRSLLTYFIFVSSDNK